jgi:hypothetical protein
MTEIWGTSGEQDKGLGRFGGGEEYKVFQDSWGHCPRGHEGRDRASFVKDKNNCNA